MLTCERGTVRYRLACVPRFDYGTIVPHLALLDAAIRDRARRRGRAVPDDFDRARDPRRRIRRRGRPRSGRAALRGPARRRPVRARGAGDHPRADPALAGRGPTVRGGLGAALHVRRAGPRARRAQRDGAQGADVRAIGRDDRRADDVAARARGRRAELGLPLRLAPRRVVRPERAVRARILRGGAGLPALARLDGGRTREGPSDRLRRRRRAPTDGVRGCGARRLSRVPTRPHRQCGREAVPTRRLRGDPRRDPHGIRSGPCVRARAVAIPHASGRLRRRALARARRRHLGEPERTQAPRPLEGHVLGRARSRPADRGDPWPALQQRALGLRAGRGPCRRAGKGLERDTRIVRPGVRRRRSRRREPS